jgi:hypothetical protein
MAEFLFAYGSLINSESRGAKSATGNALPARIFGLRRGWYLPVPEDCNTGLGAVFSEGSTCNGVLLAKESTSFEETDVREKQHGYLRVAFRPANISVLSRLKIEMDKVWVYVTNEPSYPTEALPIAQSYLDVVLTGCLEIGDEFAIEFISTTSGWESPWIDDRHQPQYRRAIAVDTTRIDRILKSIIPKHFAKRRKR